MVFIVYQDLGNEALKRKSFLSYNIYILSWEHSFAKVTHSKFRRLPAQGRKLRF